MAYKNVRLGDLVEVISGGAFKSKFFTEENTGMPLIRIRDVTKGYSETYYFGEFDDKYIINDGDLLITMDGEFNIREWHGGQALLNQRVCKIESKDPHLKQKFLLYVMPAILREIEDKTPYVTVKHLSVKKIIEAKIPLPSVEIQEKIIEILYKSQLLIKQREQQIEALSALKQSIFLDMFGDPQLNTKKWAIGKIGDLTEKTQYGTSKKASETDGTYPVLRMNNITYSGEMDLQDLKYVDLTEKERDKYLVYPGELLFNRTNSRELVGKTAVYKEKDPVAYAGYLVKLIPNDKGNSVFISGYLNSNYGKRYLFNLAKNSIGMSNINATELKNIPIYIPPIDLQSKYDDKISLIDEKMDLLKKGLKGFEELYDGLLFKAFSGELFTKEDLKV